MAKLLSGRNGIIGTWERLVGLGILFAIVLWLLSLALSHFIVEPLTCGINGSASQCGQALNISGGIASVLVAVGATFVGIWWRVARSAFVAISATIMLWGLAGWLDGLFWLEALGWCILVGAITYLLFGWLSRTQSIAVTLILTVIILIAEHIALSL